MMVKKLFLHAKMERQYLESESDVSVNDLVK
jgi:hypothetical protein